MNRRRLVLAGGTVAFTAIGVVRRKRRPPRDGLSPTPTRVVVAVPLAGYVMFALPSMPDLPAIFLKFWNLGNLIWDQISSIVLGILQEAWSLLEEAVDAALGALEWTLVQVKETIMDVADASLTALRAVGGVIADSYDMLDMAFANFRQQARAMLEGAFNSVADFVLEQIPDILRSIFGDGWDLLMRLVDLGWSGVDFLINLVDDPIGFLWDLLKDVVNDAIDVAMGGIGLGADLFEQIVRQGLSIIFAGYGDVIDVIKKIWHILEWLATHVDDFTIDVLEGIVNTSWQSIQQDIVESVDENINDFEGLVRKVFGLSNVQ